MDVIALHGAGHEHAVAAMGTSLTERQRTRAAPVADAVLLCFDADAAGQEAAVRGLAAGRARLGCGSPRCRRDATRLTSAGGRERFEAVMAGRESCWRSAMGRALRAGRLSTTGPRRGLRRCRALLTRPRRGPERDEQQRRVAGTPAAVARTRAALVPGRHGAPPRPIRGRAGDPPKERSGGGVRAPGGCCAWPRGAEGREIIANERLAGAAAVGSFRVIGGCGRGQPAEGLERAAAGGARADVGDFEAETDGTGPRARDGGYGAGLARLAGVELADIRDRITRPQEKSLQSDE